MTFRINLLLATGTLTLAYLMLKFYKNNVKQITENNSNSSDSKESVTEDTCKKELPESSKPIKRKLDESEKAMKILKAKPNFFLGFKVYDVGIHQKVKKLQEKIIEKNPALHPALVNVSTLHVTLAVTHLANDADIKAVKTKLDEWADKNTKCFFQEPVTLTFNTVQTFNDVVAYVAVDQNENFQKISNLSQAMNDILSSAGFSIDKRSFTPHLTILKLSKDYKLIRSKKKFKKDFEVLKKCQDHFGSQQVSHIQLLSMNEPKTENGYYKCIHQINVSEEQSEDDHSECCTPIPKPKTPD